MNKPGAWILTILGMKHSGKSTLARALVELSPRPVYILDPKYEYPGQVFQDVAKFLAAAKKKELDPQGLYCFRIGEVEAVPPLFGMAAATGGTLVVEEAHMWCNANYIHESLKDAIFSAAHAGLNQIYISQRSASIHNHIISQADCLISFRQELDADIKRLNSRLPDAERVRGLATGDYLQTDPLPAELADPDIRPS